MDAAAFVLLAFMSTGILHKACGKNITAITALYGETIVVPCSRTPPPENLMFVKWKYEKTDGSSGDLLVIQTTTNQATVQATDNYATRVSIDDKFSLLISQATLTDQKTFTCMVVTSSNLMEYPSIVTVYKTPSSLDIMDKPGVLHKDKPTMVGTCIAADANPAATVTWTKNKKPLLADGKAIVITSSMKVDPATGLSTSTSSLQYAATKEDIGISPVFACVSTHVLNNQTANAGPFAVHYPSEQVTLQIPTNRSIIEGNNVVLKCKADGNPPPSSFFFHIKGQKVLVENSDNYTLTAISREATGEYKCSLADNEKIVDSKSIVVNYLDLNLSAEVVKKVGDSLTVHVEKRVSGDHKLSWTKNGNAVKDPHFTNLTYSDAGFYWCEVSMTGLTLRQGFKLVIEGKPMITSLTKERAGDSHQSKVLTCEAQGVPEPLFNWSISSTEVESRTQSYVNGRAISKIRMSPKLNLNVSCMASNTLGQDVRTIYVSSGFKEEHEKRDSRDDSEDQSKVIVGVVVGLIVAAAAGGLIYWIYMKNRRGSWKTGEKEVGTPEESKKLGESNHHEDCTV